VKSQQNRNRSGAFGKNLETASNDLDRSRLIELGDEGSLTMMTQKEKDRYWLVVRECLVAFHGQKRLIANARVNFYRARIDSAEPQIASDVFYHNEPFDIACDIAGRDLLMNEDLFTKY